MFGEKRHEAQAATMVCHLLKMLAPSFVLLLTLGCNADNHQGDSHAEVIYKTILGERVTLTSVLPGRVSAAVMSEVRPQVDGIIQERLFEEGGNVIKGQVLYQIDPAQYQAAYNTAKASLEEALAAAVALRLKEERYRRLISEKAISQQEFDDAISNHAQARARVARARATLETAAINLAYTQIKAPVAGRIGRSAFTPGALVTANQSVPLAVIQQTENVYVDINQSSLDMLRLRRQWAQNAVVRNEGSAKVHLLMEDDTPYTLTGDYQSVPPRWIEGELLSSEITVGQSTGNVNLRAVFPNPEGLLLPGMYVKATIEEGDVENAILVPQRAIVSDNSGASYALVLEKDASGADLFLVKRRAVALGRAQGKNWLVRSGLKPGDAIVVVGLQKAIPDEVVKGLPQQEDPVSLSFRKPAQAD